MTRLSAPQSCDKIKAATAAPRQNWFVQGETPVSQPASQPALRLPAWTDLQWGHMQSHSVLSPSLSLTLGSQSSDQTVLYKGTR